MLYQVAFCLQWLIALLAMVAAETPTFNRVISMSHLKRPPLFPFLLASYALRLSKFPKTVIGRISKLCVIEIWSCGTFYKRGFELCFILFCKTMTSEELEANYYSSP